MTEREEELSLKITDLKLEKYNLIKYLEKQIKDCESIIAQLHEQATKSRGIGKTFTNNKIIERLIYKEILKKIKEGKYE